VVFNFWWSFEPAIEGTYSPFDANFLFLFAHDRHKDDMISAQFTRKKLTADITAHTYSYSRIPRSIFDFDRLNKVLTNTEQAALEANKFSFFWNADGVLNANDKITNAYAWQIDFSKTQYDNNSGAQEVLFERANPGVEDLSIGGANLVAFQYTDQDGIYNYEEY